MIQHEQMKKLQQPAVRARSDYISKTPEQNPFRIGMRVIGIRTGTFYGYIKDCSALEFGVCHWAHLWGAAEGTNIVYGTEIGTQYRLETPTPDFIVGQRLFGVDTLGLPVRYVGSVVEVLPARVNPGHWIARTTTHTYYNTKDMFDLRVRNGQRCPLDLTKVL